MECKISDINSFMVSFIIDNVSDRKICSNLIDNFEKKENQNLLRGILTKKFTKKTTKNTKQDGPKNPLSAYIYYCMNNREIVKEKNPDVSASNITKILAEEWNSIKNDVIKSARYKEQAANDKKRYISEIDGISSINSKKIKKPRSSYILYCSEMRSKVKEDNVAFDSKDVLKKLAEMWNIEKVNNSIVYKKFVNKANEDKIRYNQEKNQLEVKSE